MPSGPNAMSEPITLRELPDLSAGAWDDTMASYRDATVFHSSAWHQNLNEALPGRTVRFQIDRGGDVHGHWCGFLVKKFGIRVFGAPLPGTATDYMYPVLSKPLAVDEFLPAVKAWAAARRVGLVEIGGEYFDPISLTAGGYRLQPTRTYRVDLSGGESAVWQRLKPAMRNKVRKAEKSGVTVSEDTSPDFAREFSDMLRSVFNRQGKAPSYDLRRIETVVRVLGEAGRLTALTAMREGQRLAAVILLHDARTAYYWAGASYPSAYPFGANDVLQWRALQLAIARNLVCYDACGGGDYKEKFGGALVSLPAGHLVMRPVFGLVRSSVMKGFRARQALIGAVQRVATAWR
jgi:hypothetical protein